MQTWRLMTALLSTHRGGVWRPATACPVSLVRRLREGSSAGRRPGSWTSCSVRAGSRFRSQPCMPGCTFFPVAGDLLGGILESAEAGEGKGAALTNATFITVLAVFDSNLQQASRGYTVFARNIPLLSMQAWRLMTALLSTHRGGVRRPATASPVSPVRRLTGGSSTGLSRGPRRPVRSRLAPGSGPAMRARPRVVCGGG
jgi:hypothetical protein